MLCSSPWPASSAISSFTPGIAAMRFTRVPEDQRQEFSTVLDNLWRMVDEIAPRMTMYAVLLPEDLMGRFIAAVRPLMRCIYTYFRCKIQIITCQQQQSLLSSNTPKYILELPALKTVAGQIQECIALFDRAFAAMNAT